MESSGINLSSTSKDSERPKAERKIKKFLFRKHTVATFKALLDIVPDSTLPPKLSVQICARLLDNRHEITKTKILLTWIIGLLEYNLIDFESVDIFYHNYFKLLQCNNFVPLVCKLIYILTKDSSDIKRTMIRQLKDTQNFGASSKHISALLILFKSLRPDLVPESIPTQNLIQSFPLLPAEFHNKLEESAQRNQLNKTIFTSWDILKLQQKPDSGIPNVSCLNLKTLLEKQETSSAEEFLKYKREFTIEACLNSYNVLSNASALLNDKNGIYLIIFGEEKLKIRMLLYIQQTLRYELRKNSETSEIKRQRLFTTINNLLEYAQQGIPLISNIILEYFNEFLDFNLDETLLNILSWTVVTSFDELHESLLTPLKNCFICEYDPMKRAAIVRCIINLLRNFILCQVYPAVSGVEQPFSLPHENDSSALREIGAWVSRFSSEAVKAAGSSIISSVLILHYNLISLQLYLEPVIWSGVTPPRLAYASMIHTLSHLDLFCAILQKYRIIYKEAGPTSRHEKALTKVYISDLKNILIKDKLNLSKTHLSQDWEYALRSQNADYKIENHAAVLPYMCNVLRKSKNTSLDLALQVCRVYFPNLSKFFERCLPATSDQNILK